jgi:hypothetical protein
MQDRAEHIVVAKDEESPQSDIDDRALANAMNVRELA